MINELIYILQVKRRNRLLISTRILQIYFGNVVLALSKQSLINGKPVAAHICGHIPQSMLFIIHPEYLFLTRSQYRYPLRSKSKAPRRVSSKEKNQKKNQLSSLVLQRLQILQPNVCILLDIGTMPSPTSIFGYITMLPGTFDA